MNTNDIVEKIGMPAALELLAEECAELGHAALKMARKMRGENPTPADMNDIHDNLSEEIADVMVCIEALTDAGFISNESIESVIMSKNARWRERIDMTTPKKIGPCPRCNSTGMIPRPDISPLHMETCGKCNGTGEMIYE